MTSTSYPFSATQLAGYVAAILSLSAYAMRGDKMMKTGVGAGLLLWAVHYAMLSAWTASATCLLIASHRVLALIAPTMSASAAYHHRFVLPAVTAVLWLSWAGVVSLLP
jgi:hypothetical protein